MPWSEIAKSASQLGCPTTSQSLCARITSSKPLSAMLGGRPREQHFKVLRWVPIRLAIATWLRVLRRQSTPRSRSRVVDTITITSWFYVFTTNDIEDVSVIEDVSA